MLNTFFLNGNIDFITDLFLVIIIAVAIVGIVGRLYKKINFFESLPNVAVSLGILGTFVGICIGLYNFDVRDIDKSIPGLLGGLKTAFITSIAGIIASIIMRIVYECKRDREERKFKYDDPVPILNDISNNIKEIKGSTEDATVAFLKCFRSDEEYSLVSQVKLIRQEMIDSRREIKQALTEFTEKLAEVSTKSIVDALEKVIAEFNVLLNELASENFKELSLAMTNLNKWQENYKKQIDATENRIDNIASNTEEIYTKLKDLTVSLEGLEKHLAGISVSVENLSVDGKDLEKAVGQLSDQNSTLREAIEQIKEIGEKAKSVVPDINLNITKMTEALGASVNRCSESLENTAKTFAEENGKAVIELQEKIAVSQKSLTESVNHLEKHLEEQLDKSLGSLASSLASLSEKFVSDYMPLTERLREVVRLAETIDAK